MTKEPRIDSVGALSFQSAMNGAIPLDLGGRALSEEQLPKYLNSPTTALYDKSKTLYNLYEARPAIQKEGKAILVEGYFDALIPYQAGAQNVVASLGTSFSTSHADLLKRFAEETILLYDGDPAGFSGNIARITHPFSSRGCVCGLRVYLPTRDPDQFIRAQGLNGFNQLIDSAMNLIEFQIQRATQQHAIHRIDVKTQAIKEIALTLSNLKNQVELSEYTKYAAQELDIDRPVLVRELQRLGVKTSASSFAARKALTPCQQQG